MIIINWKWFANGDCMIEFETWSFVLFLERFKFEMVQQTQCNQIHNRTMAFNEQIDAVNVLSDIGILFHNVQFDNKK